MAVRIHFPWGLTLSVLGFAALGAAAAYLLVEDFHGHIYRECLLHAVAGGVLGACGWFFSERVSERANLNTSPFLRLAFSGLAAVVVAAWVAGPFAELTTGAQAWWLEAAGVLLYVAAGILPLIAGLALLAGLETMLAAQRGGASAIDALRPILPQFAFGVLLLAAVIGSALYLRSQLRDLVVQLTPEVLRTSGWIEREQRLYTEVLRGGGCEVLVAPFDAPADAPGLDRPARSLITRHVAVEVAAQTGLCVVDPTLASRALGATARSHPLSDILFLADAAGAQWIVRGETALTQDGTSFDFTAQLLVREAGPKPRWNASDAAAWGPIAFSDSLPPEAAFAAVAAGLMEQVGLPGSRKPGTQRPYHLGDPAVRTLPPTAAELATDPGSAYARAEQLQLLAAVYPRGDVAGEHLWERSLVALRDAPVGDASARVLRARAALHLYRRPHAVALLQGVQSLEAGAVLAVAQGNPFEAEELAPRLPGQAAALIARLEAETLRTAYARDGGQGERRDALLAAHPGYAALLLAPLSTDAGAQLEARAGVQRELVRLGAQLKDDPQDVLRRASRVLMLDFAFDDDVLREAASIERACEDLWRGNAAQWRSQRAWDRLADWDVYDALCAANRAALVRSAAALHAHAGAEGVLALARALSPLYGGFPPLQPGIAQALNDVRARKRSEDSLDEQRARRLARDVAAWEGGETEIARAFATLQPRALTVYDEPPRSWRTVDDVGAADKLAAAFRVLDYAQDSFGLLERTHAALRSAGRLEEAQRLVAANQDRFVGHPARDRFLLQRAEELGDVAAYIGLFERRIREQPQAWDRYLQLAQAWLRTHDPQRAQGKLLAYPPFATLQGGEPDKAWQGGELLLWAGEPDLARPLFEIAAGDRNVSAAAMWSAMRLAQLAGKWDEARERARQLHERHQAPGALARAAELSFVLDEHEEGWRTFYEAAKRFETIGPWSAAAAGHRIAKTPQDEVIAFAKRWQSLSGHPASEARIKDSFVFHMLLIDRPQNPRTFETFLSFAGRGGDRTGQQLAAGYQAFRRSDFSTATDMFVEMTAAGTRAEAAYALPYLAASLAQSRRARDAESLLNGAAAKVSAGTWSWLARAYVSGLGGDANRALDALWQAQTSLAFARDAAVPPAYQVLETCEILHQLTGDGRYRELLLDLARRQQKAWPYSWAYAFEAKYATDARERERAAAIALYLDPQSEHLAGFGEAQRKHAAEWFARNNPFKKP
jgi:hypothetical protein